MNWEFDAVAVDRDAECSLSVKIYAVKKYGEYRIGITN